MPTLEFDTSKMIRITSKNAEIGAVVFGRKKGDDEWFVGYIGEGDPRYTGYRFEKLGENYDWYGEERQRRLYISAPHGSVLEDEWKNYELYEPPGRPPCPPRLFCSKRGSVEFEIRFPQLYFPHTCDEWKQFNRQEKRSSKD